MDIVYVCRKGQNEELRYSLRSVAQHVLYDNIFIVGGAPSWVDKEQVHMIPRGTRRTKYATTDSHVRHACMDDRISNPFILFNDDFFAVKPVGEVRTTHRGPLHQVLHEYRNLRNAWAIGLSETAKLLERETSRSDLLCYETHTPMIVHKAAMLEALDLAAASGISTPQKRTLYGNLTGIGGYEIADPKWTSVQSEPPRGPWMSSGDQSFNRVALPVLKWLFPHPGPYED